MSIRNIFLTDSANDPLLVDVSNSAPADESILAEIHTGKGVLADDPQSGSIMKLLLENGFGQKITQGSKSGHTYSIIHNAPSTEFILIDSWQEGDQTRKAYHAFTVKQPEPKKTITNIPIPKPASSPSPAADIIDSLDHEFDDFLATYQKN